MIRVGLGRGASHYAGLFAPWHPDEFYPELEAQLGGQSGPGENTVFRAVRDALRALGLDRCRIDTPSWNPLGEYVAEGGTIVLKPNFIRHWNPEAERCGDASIESVITHGAILRAAAEYAFLAVGRSGRVIVAEAPQQDCDFAAIRRIAGLDEMQAHYAKIPGLELEVIDLRRECVRFKNGVIVSREPLPGDPEGYRAVDLGEQSFFSNSGLDPSLMRGADYDSAPTGEHHSNGRNAFLLSETVLSSDLVINLPKLKTHKKTGVTLALKNLVGINGDKNWLPHHCAGSLDQGGDEFPGAAIVDRTRSRLTEWGRYWLKKGMGTRLIGLARSFEDALRGENFIRAGNWHGNRTTWRMCSDLNRCLYYSDRDGVHLDAAQPVHPVLTILDGIVAGEKNGPLTPLDLPLGVVLASADPIAVDLAALRLMDFDPRRIPKIHETMASEELRITAVGDPSEVEIAECISEATGERDSFRVYPLADLRSARPFTPHPGWLNHIENSTDQDE